MTVSASELQVTWDTGNNDSGAIASGGNDLSDAMSFAATAFVASVQIEAQNNGTPAAGDTMDFFIVYTNGDVAGAGSDTYDTVEHAVFLATLDTNTENNARRTVPIMAASKAFKVYAINNAASNTITAAATVYEKKVA